MKKMRSFFCALCMMALMSVSCVQDLPVEEVTTRPEKPVVRDTVSFTASLEASDTKTSLSATSVLWNTGDKIKLFNADHPSGVEFELKEGAGTTKGLFSGEAMGDGPYYAVYPSSCAGTLSGTSVSVTLPAEQAYAEGSFGAGANLSFARAADQLENLSFRNVCGSLSLTLTGSGAITSLRLYTKGDEVLHGAGTLSMVEGLPVLNMAAGQTAPSLRYITLNCGGVSLTGGKTFYLVVPAGTLASGFTVEAVDASGDAMILNANAGANRVVNRSKVRPMPETGYLARYRAAYLQTEAVSGAWNGTLAGSTLENCCTYDEATGQYAYLNSETSRMYRMQDWTAGYALTLNTPRNLTLGSQVTVSVTSLGLSTVSSATDVTMRVVKRFDGRAWLVDETSGAGYVMKVIE